MSHALGQLPRLGGRLSVAAVVGLAAASSAALAQGTPPASRPAGAGTTATVNITIRVVSYVEISLTANQTREIVVGGSTSTGSASIGGEVVANVPVNITATIQKPSHVDAPTSAGDREEWTATAAVSQLAGGRHQFPALLTISVSNAKGRARTYFVTTGGITRQDGATATITPQTGTAGSATITVAPK